MRKRKQHPCKEIEKTIQFAEDYGWRYKAAGNSAHAWGRLLCPLQTPEGCILSIWSTPRNNMAHARQIMARVKRCPHMREIK